MNTLERITEIYENYENSESKIIDIVLNNLDKDYSNFLGTTFSKYKAKFEYYFFVKKDIVQAKQALYSAGKCEEHKFQNFKKSNPIIQRAFYLLLSDSTELIHSFKNWEFYDHDYWVKHGAKVIVIQEILKDNFEKALQLLEAFNDSSKKYPLKETDSKILKAIINKDKEEVEKLLKFFLLPKNHKKVNDTLMLSTELFSLHASGFAKLAWLKGIEVEIDHPLLPMELLPIRPNEEYFIEYDFLKPDYKPSVSTNNEITKPSTGSKKGFLGKWFK